MIQLRDYQEAASDQLEQDYYQGKNACVISPTASGKTIIIKDFVERMKRKQPFLKICVATHRLEILNNLRDTVGEYADFQTIQKLSRSPELQYDMLVIDECVDGDTEVLTEYGFVPFKDYNQQHRVAQWFPDGKIEFVAPSRTVIKPTFSMNKIQLLTGHTVLMTDHHRQPRISRTGSLIVDHGKDIGHSPKEGVLPSYGQLETPTNPRLTSLDRLRIFLYNKGTDIYMKNTRMYRTKIQLTDPLLALMLESLLGECGFSYQLDSLKSLYTVNSVEQLLIPLHKQTRLFELGELNGEEFIKCLLDAQKHGLSNTLRFHEKQDCDFVQAAAALNGFKTTYKEAKAYRNYYELVVHEDRNTTYRSVKHLGIDETFQLSYCVTVPSGFFVARTSSGMVFVTGNCHHVTAQSYRKVIETNTRWHCGFTATPIRGYMPEYPDFIPVYKDTWKTELTGLVNDELYQDFILTKSTEELIKLGYLCDYEFVHDYDFHIKHQGSNNVDYTKTEIDKAITSKECVDYVNSTLGQKKGIVFCHSIDFAEQVDRGLGDKSVLITSKTPKTEREAYFQAFRENRIQLLVNVDIFSEGVDVPAVDCVYLFRPTRSIPVFFQQIGRALRLSEGKTKAIIYDYVNNLKRLGVEPKDIELKDMLLSGKFIKESCEYCGAYGVIEGKRDRKIGSVPNDYVRSITRWLSNNEGRYYFHYDSKQRHVQVHVDNFLLLDPMESLEYMTLFVNVWFQIYNLPVILNQYRRWEVMNERNLAYAIERKTSLCLKVQGGCKYSDASHDYYIVTDNLKKVEREHIAKIK